MNPLGRKIARTKLQLSQKEVAEILGVDPSFISKAESEEHGLNPETIADYEQLLKELKEKK